MSTRVRQSSILRPLLLPLGLAGISALPVMMPHPVMPQRITPDGTATLLAEHQPGNPDGAAIGSARPKPAPIVYTVRPGDTLFGIAQRYTNGDFMSIYQANIATIGGNDNLIYPDQKIVIPNAAVQPNTAAVSAAGMSANASGWLNGAWSIFNLPNGQMQAVGFAQALLRAIGAPVTPGNLQVIYQWQESEGSGGQNNPLNGGDFNGMATSGQQFGGGANNYPTLAVNVRAMAGILTTDTQYGYGAIVAALRTNNQMAAVAAIWASQWAFSHYGYGSDWSTASLPSGTPVGV